MKLKVGKGWHVAILFLFPGNAGCLKTLAQKKDAKFNFSQRRNERSERTFFASAAALREIILRAFLRVDL